MSTLQVPPADARRAADRAVPTSGPRSLAGFGPNWFASVMGTGIVAIAAAGLPVQVPGQRTFAEVVWVLDVVLLLAVAATTALHWRRHPEVARSWLDDPVMSHFYGAPAMALLTVGAGTLLVGTALVGEPTAVRVASGLWCAGTGLGLWTAFTVPYRAFVHHTVAADAACGGWLMPVVPPMVSAATGAALVPHLPPGQWRLSMLLACYAMFGLTLLASAVVIPQLWSRLMHHGVGASAAVPTLWIVLGPLGQSITAAGNLGAQAPAVLPPLYGQVMQALGVVYGLPVWGFALLWGAISLGVTVRTVRTGLPFSLAWWSFTFPVGTLVTGTSGLALHTGSSALRDASVVLFAALVAAWAAVAVRTARALCSGHLLAAAPGAVIKTAS